MFTSKINNKKQCQNIHINDKKQIIIINKSIGFLSEHKPPPYVSIFVLGSCNQVCGNFFKIVCPFRFSGLPRLGLKYLGRKHLPKQIRKLTTQTDEKKKKLNNAKNLKNQQNISKNYFINKSLSYHLLLFKLNEQLICDKYEVTTLKVEKTNEVLK